MDLGKHTELANNTWAVAELLRGDYRRHDYGKVVLPFTVLRRLECVMEPTRDAVVAAYAGGEGEVRERRLRRVAGLTFYNTTGLTLKKISGDPAHAADRLREYIAGFSENVRLIMERYEFHQQIKKLSEANLLYKVAAQFADLDLSPAAVPNQQMGYVFEDLIRRFYEVSNETAGEHYTPREVIELMANLLVAPDKELLRQGEVGRRIFDPACGTGGMLSAVEDVIKGYNGSAEVKVFGQELNPESWATCASDLLIKGQEADDVTFGNSFTDDGHLREKFDYMLANPPFGVDWKKVKDEIETEFKDDPDGKFRAGLPRINDGSFLFLQHMVSKMKPVALGGTRIAVVFNGSPLFTGAAGSGESNIRRWILDNDWLEAIVALPDQLFFNTGIATYFWILTNRKAEDHKGKVILVDGRRHWQKMRKSLGDKRKEISKDQIRELTQIYGDAVAIAADPDHPHHANVKIFDNDDFGYRRITVERPLKLRFDLTDDALTALATARPVKAMPEAEAFIDALRPLLGSSWPTKAEAWLALKDATIKAGLLWPSGAPFTKALRDAIGVRDPQGEVQKIKGAPEPDPDLRDYENVPLHEDPEDYLKREVLPHVPDAWIDHTKTKIGYEIPFTRHFYVYEPPRPLSEIDADLKSLEAEIQALLKQVTE